jgi:hypothetical protein
VKVFVYFNLHQKVWSIRAEDGQYRGKVLAHARQVHLTDVVFKVSEAGRQRVLAEGRKNVHAGVSGELVGVFGTVGRRRYPVSLPVAYRDEVFVPMPDEAGVSYNPHKDGSFVRRSDGAPVSHATDVRMLANGHGTRLVYARGLLVPPKDFVLQNSGSVSILYPQTERAREWVRERIAEDAQTWGPRGVVIEARYVGDILNGIAEEGLTV